MLKAFNKTSFWRQLPLYAGKVFLIQWNRTCSWYVWSFRYARMLATSTIFYLLVEGRR